ncbi:MAG TPA: glycosyltransferase family 4 protein [Solirubrobacteraceae bacterium]|jgi:glycosyltransferase involved in cell wall biosynthesis|nr:glycosyltransferase family 4 protein [Solirubrobacteraceae bacterium]
MVAVFEALAEKSDLTVFFCSVSGTRAMPWERQRLDFEHRFVVGHAIRRSTPDATDFYPSPQVFARLIANHSDLVISSGFSFPSLYAAAYCRLWGRRLLIHSDGTASSEAGIGRGQRFTRRALSSLADGAIGNSKQAVRRFEELGFAPVFEAPHSTAMEPFTAVGLARAYDPAAVLHVITAGRLIPRKGVDRLLRAVAEARTRDVVVNLTIVGSGEEEAHLRSLAGELGLNDVAWIGFVQQRELPMLFAQANVFAFPTLDDPFGIVLLEAAASGLPLIASPRGGATEDLVSDQGSGVVVDPDDTEAFAIALTTLARDPALRERMGRTAHEIAKVRTPTNTADAYLRAAAATLRPDEFTAVVYSGATESARTLDYQRTEAHPDVSVIEAPQSLPNGAVPPSNPRVSLGEAVRRYPLLVIVSTLILAGAGVALGLHRESIYTATSEAVVEPLAPTVVQLSGAVQAAEDLATNESRLIKSDGITNPLAQQFRTTHLSVANHLSATPVPNSTVIKVSAESSSESGAVALANAATEKFATYTTAALQTNTIAKRLLKAYTAAALNYRRALGAQERLGTKASKQLQLEAGAAVDAAKISQQALSQQYENLVQSHSTAPTITPFVLATAATNDRTSKLETYVFAGILAGLLIGCALATFLASRRLRRGLES